MYLDLNELRHRIRLYTLLVFVELVSLPVFLLN
jgi:hypothetical protein